MKINKDTDIAIFEALFVAVKEVLLKPYLRNFSSFIKSSDISGTKLALKFREK